MKIRILLLSLVAMLVFDGCKRPYDEELGKIQVNIKATMNGAPFVVGEIYTNEMGDRFRADLFKSYISNFKAIKTTGEEVNIRDIYLANFDEPNVIVVEVEPGTYSGFRYGIGVPEEINKDTDPSQYANDHPLSALGSEGMFWTWNSGYIFTTFEGKADTLDTENVEPLHPFAYHCGEDFLYIQKDEEMLFDVEVCQTKRFNLVFEVDKFWYSDEDEIDVAVDYLTHTSGNVPLAERFMALVEKAVHIE